VPLSPDLAAGGSSTPVSASGLNVRLAEIARETSGLGDLPSEA